MEVLTLSEGPEGEELRRAAKQQRDGRTRIRFLAMALMHNGKTVPEVARVARKRPELGRAPLHPLDPNPHISQQFTRPAAQCLCTQAT